MDLRSLRIAAYTRITPQDAKERAPIMTATATATATRDMLRTTSDEAWEAYMAQRKIEDAAEAASKAANYQDADAELARERAERKATRLLRAYERTVDHIRVD